MANSRGSDHVGTTADQHSARWKDYNPNGEQWWRSQYDVTSKYEWKGFKEAARSGKWENVKSIDEQNKTLSSKSDKDKHRGAAYSAKEEEWPTYAEECRMHKRWSIPETPSSSRDDARAQHRSQQIAVHGLRESTIAADSTSP